jgi:hypothetical protein
MAAIISAFDFFLGNFFTLSGEAYVFLFFCALSALATLCSSGGD